MDADEFELFRETGESAPEPVVAEDRWDGGLDESRAGLERRISATLSASLPRVLVIDDDPTIREALHHLIADEYDLILCQSGLEGLARVTDAVSAVILDIKMEGMDGFETYRGLREKVPGLPILFHSAFQDRKDPYEIINDYRPFAFIKKGGSFAELKNALRSAVEHSRQITRNTMLVEELEKLAQAYARFVPPQSLAFLEKQSIVEIELGHAVQQEMTIMFSDIRSFTALSENMTPQENFSFLNSYLSRMGPVIRAEGGYIDKYIGDAVMALFPEEADRAIRAALRMIHELRILNELRTEHGRLPIETVTGIHTGSLMLGTIGERERMELTVISDAVNLAARMEGVCKLYNVRLAISGPTLFSLQDPDRYHYRFLGAIAVKGKTEPVSVFEIYDEDPPRMRDLKIETRARFEEGVNQYVNQNLTAAAEVFSEHLAKFPEDTAAAYLLASCDPAARTPESKMSD